VTPTNAARPGPDNPVVSIPSRSAPTGLHRRAARPGPLRRGVDLVARVGGVVSLAALLVLGVAVAGSLDGAPATGAPQGVRYADR
jgi:hypothetical protein